MFGRMARHQAHVNGNGDHVAHHGDQARHHGRCKQLGNVLLGQDGVDDQRHRGWNQDAQGAPRRQGARGQAARVAMALHFGQGHAGDGGGGGHRGAANSTKRATGEHSAHGQAAFEPAHDRSGKLKQGLADAALRGKVAHQNEQGNDRQVVVGQARKGQIVQKV